MPRTGYQARKPGGHLTRRRQNGVLSGMEACEKRHIFPSFTSAQHAQQKGARAVMLRHSTQGNAEPKDAQKKERDRYRPSKCDDPRDAGRACEPEQRSSGPSMAFSAFFSPDSQRCACRLCFLETIRSVRCSSTCTRLPSSGDQEQQQLLQPVPGGSKVGAVLGRDGTTPQPQLHPRRSRSRSLTSA